MAAEAKALFDKGTVDQAIFKKLADDYEKHYLRRSAVTVAKLVEAAGGVQYKVLAPHEARRDIKMAIHTGRSYPVSEYNYPPDRASFGVRVFRFDGEYEGSGLDRVAVYNEVVETPPDRRREDVDRILRLEAQNQTLRERNQDLQERNDRQKRRILEIARIVNGQTPNL